MSKNIMNDPDCKLITETLKNSGETQKTFNASAYSTERLNQIKAMLNTSGQYSATLVMLQNRIPGIHVELNDDGAYSQIQSNDVLSSEDSFLSDVQNKSQEYFFEVSDSSAIKSVRWDNKVLSVVYVSNTQKVYQWGEVPLELFEEFKNAESKGKFCDKYVKNGGFPEVYS